MFVVLLFGSGAGVRERVEGLRAAVVRTPVATREGPIQASVSIGVAAGPDASTPGPSALLERAWAACVRARQPGQGGIAIA